jgi:L-seryl-tRNA(Ser) seleniumtransferase
MERVLDRAAAITRPSLKPVINATGVIIQTNLGRAPLSAAALQAMREVGEGYSNLEYDLQAGERGSRATHLNDILCRLTGAEAALAVNNNAAAVYLVLMALAHGREVIISRGQAVEIGGGFRIPDVLSQSGAVLVEVGTTNRTYARDYEQAITERTALLMRIHTSNFKLVGFVHETPLQELAEVAHKHNIAVLDDLGSGTLLPTAPFGLAPEPTVQESIAAGANLVAFSGDKLLGGPQAGLIVGRKTLIDQLKRHPLVRALRVDKTTIAGLEATLRSYLSGRATAEIPVWRMIAASTDMLHTRAIRLVEAIGNDISCVASCTSAIGGGSLPGETLPSFAVALIGDQPDALAYRLRTNASPVVGRIHEGRLLLDVRTVLEEQEAALVEAVRRACNSH